jgi:hypothetical protein
LLFAESRVVPILFWLFDSQSSTQGKSIGPNRRRTIASAFP